MAVFPEISRLSALEFFARVFFLPKKIDIKASGSFKALYAVQAKYPTPLRFESTTGSSRAGCLSYAPCFLVFSKLGAGF